VRKTTINITNFHFERDHMKMRNKSPEPATGSSEKMQDSYTASSEPIAYPHELIERRAYEIWRQRGAGAGDEMKDWLQAEAEILGAFETGSLDETDDQKERIQRTAYGR
jgi:hypothetical protein